MKPSTDREARMTLVSADLREVLYADGRRTHLPVNHVFDGVEVLCLELLQIAGADSLLLAVHTVGDPGGLPRRADAPGRTFWDDLRSALLGPLTFQPGVRVVTFSPDTLAGHDGLETGYGAVTGMTGAHLQRARQHELSVARDDWSALVLRDGVGIVSHPTLDRSFAPHLRVQAHSIFVDAVLLAWMQRVLLDASGRRAMRAKLDRPDDLVDLERRHYDFKRTTWRRHLTSKRTAPVDKVLQDLQAELLTNLDIEDVEDRVKDGARLARTLNQERHAAAEERLNSFVQKAAVIIGAFGLAFAAAPTLVGPSVRAFVWALLAGFILILISGVTLFVAAVRRAGDGTSEPATDQHGQG